MMNRFETKSTHRLGNKSVSVNKIYQTEIKNICVAEQPVGEEVITVTATDCNKQESTIELHEVYHKNKDVIVSSLDLFKPPESKMKSVVAKAYKHFLKKEFSN